MAGTASLNAWKNVRLQPHYMTDFLTVGAVTSASDANYCAQSVQLAAKNSAATINRSNIPGGKLPGQQQLQIRALRFESFFYSTGGDVTGPSTLSGVAELQNHHLHATSVAVRITDQPVASFPAVMAPAGMGPWGFVSDSVRPIVTNGEPANGAKYVIPEASAPVLELQAVLNVDLQRDVLGSLNVTSEINAFKGLKVCRFYADGILLQSATGAY